MRTHRETPVKVVLKSGAVRWKARYTNKLGKRVSAGTYALKGPCRNPRLKAADCCAQHAIDAAYDRDEEVARRHGAQTFGQFAKTWTERHPRATNTNKTANHRLASVLDAEIEGRKLRDWPYNELRRRHALDLVADLLTKQGRAAEGARGVMRVLSAMTGDALDEEVVEQNPFQVKIRDDDPRVRKAGRKPRVYTLEQMRAFAAGVPEYEGMLRAMADLGLRLGEDIGLDRRDILRTPKGDFISVRGTALPDGTFVEGNSPTKRHVRQIPLAASTDALITPRIDTPVLFATPTGKRWMQRNFYRTVWNAARAATPSMADARPQDFRHSWVSYMRAQPGITEADLADAAGHSVETQNAIYLHPTGQSDEAIRRAIG